MLEAQTNMPLISVFHAAYSCDYDALLKRIKKETNTSVWAAIAITFAGLTMDKKQEVYNALETDENRQKLMDSGLVSDNVKKQLLLPAIVSNSFEYHQLPAGITFGDLRKHLREIKKNIKNLDEYLKRDEAINADDITPYVLWLALANNFDTASQRLFDMQSAKAAKALDVYLKAYKPVDNAAIVDWISDLFKDEPRLLQRPALIRIIDKHTSLCGYYAAASEKLREKICEVVNEDTRVSLISHVQTIRNEEARKIKNKDTIAKLQTWEKAILKAIGRYGSTKEDIARMCPQDSKLLEKRLKEMVDNKILSKRQAATDPTAVLYFKVA